MENIKQNISNTISQGGPSVQIFQNITKENPLKRLFSFPKLLFLILGVIILIEIIIGFRTLTSPSSTFNLTQKQPITSGQLVVLTESQSAKAGDKLPIVLRIVTGGHQINAVDVVLRYDPKVLEASGAGFFEKGGIFSEYPLVNIDSQKGIISISANTSPAEAGFNGIGSFATLNFKVTQNGQITLSAEYQKSSTTDSNFLSEDTGDDVLGGVYNLDLNIGSSKLTSRPEVKSCDGFIQSCLDSQGNPGIQQCSGGVLKQNICLWEPNLTESCGICQQGE